MFQGTTDNSNLKQWESHGPAKSHMAQQIWYGIKNGVFVWIDGNKCPFCIQQAPLTSKTLEIFCITDRF